MLNRTMAPPIADAVSFSLKLMPYQKFTLDNGVEVYAVDAGAEEVLQMEWYFYAGNWYEPKNLVASAANSLLRSGTSAKNAFQINEHFEYYGSFLKRSCSTEMANITLHSLSKHVDALLPVVKELIIDAVFPEEELNIFIQNSKQKLSINKRKSDFIANQQIDVSLYGEQHPYGRYSKEEDFDQLVKEELLQYYRQHYTNGKFIIFVSGKIPSNLITQLNLHFGDLPNQFIGEKKHDIASATQKRSRIVNDENGVQGSIRIARHFPNRHHPDFTKSLVLNTVFGGFFGSRLMSNIREEKGYTYGIHSFLQNHLGQSAWMISTEAGKDVCDATIDEVYKEMKELRETPVDEDELLLVKNYMIGSILGDLDGPFQIMGRWKNNILNKLDENYFYNNINSIKNISAQELQALAQQYLVPDDFYELVVV